MPHATCAVESRFEQKFFFQNKNLSVANGVRIGTSSAISEAYEQSE